MSDGNMSDGKKCIKNRVYILLSKSTSKDAIQHLELKSIM